MATHFIILAWKIPWTEEPVGLQSRDVQRVGHDWAHTHTHTHTHTRNYYVPENVLCIRDTKVKIFSIMELAWMQTYI